MRNHPGVGAGPPEIPALAPPPPCIKALKALSVRSFALCSPYRRGLNAREKEFLKAQGSGYGHGRSGAGQEDPPLPLWPRGRFLISASRNLIPLSTARMVNSPKPGVSFPAPIFGRPEVIERLGERPGQTGPFEQSGTVGAALRSLSIQDLYPGVGEPLRLNESMTKANTTKQIRGSSDRVGKKEEITRSAQAQGGIPPGLAASAGKARGLRSASWLPQGTRPLTPLPQN